MIKSLKINELTKNKIIKDYSIYQKENPNEYILFFAKNNLLNISIYKKKKTSYSLVINSNIEKLITDFINKYKIVENETPHFIDFVEQIGSDEVGTGDFLGPIIVVASLIKEKDLKILNELKIMDSKKLEDEEILKIGKVLINKIKYSCLTLDNEKYNAQIKKGMNINQIKVLMHNRALFNLASKNKEIKNIFVDQFTPANNYFNYLKNETNVVKNITFKTKGESYFISVAASSIIARYTFLNYMSELNKKYNLNFPFGAGSIVDNFSKKFIKKYSLKELEKIAKINFKNFQKI